MYKGLHAVFLALVVGYLACADRERDATPKSTSAQNYEELKIKAPEESTILEGLGTVSVKLGMSRVELTAHLGTPNNVFENLYCGQTHLQWFEVRSDGSVEDGDGLNVYLKDDAAYHITFSSERFRTEEGITFGSELRELFTVYPELDVFTLSRSSSNATNDRDRFFGVVEPKGIAFELIIGEKKSEGSVVSVEVYKEDTEFRPQGCVGEDQEKNSVDIS